MKQQQILLSLLIGLNLGCTHESRFLIKIHEGVEDEMGVRCGYVNQKGDTIIPLGKYPYCYTDTIRNIGFILRQDGTCKAIDQSGQEIYEVYWYDNGPDYVSDGMFRIKEKGKIGYADQDGTIRIKPQFDCANPFENGKARVAYQCRQIQDGEHTIAESDTWIFINKKGEPIKE